jgi:hypothetical protein
MHGHMNVKYLEHTRRIEAWHKDMSITSFYTQLRRTPKNISVLYNPRIFLAMVQKISDVSRISEVWYRNFFFPIMWPKLNFPKMSL